MSRGLINDCADLSLQDTESEDNRPGAGWLTEQQKRESESAFEPILRITFLVTVEASESQIREHLGSRASAELHDGGAVYLNDLVPEFEYESGPIESVLNL